MTTTFVYRKHRIDKYMTTIHESKLILCKKIFVIFIAYKKWFTWGATSNIKLKRSPYCSPMLDNLWAGSNMNTSHVI